MKVRLYWESSNSGDNRLGSWVRSGSLVVAENGKNYINQSAS